jgi:hypothetical protein
MLALEDLKEMSEAEVKNHLASEYSGEAEYDTPNEAQIEKAKSFLNDFEILIAYESVGSWGCDSSSFFLLKDKIDGKLFEINGSHCSCYGFEGQLKLEETSLEALKFRIEKGESLFYCGGYDENENQNQQSVNEFVLAQHNSKSDLFNSAYHSS